jgi:hypothetical protein
MQLAVVTVSSSHPSNAVSNLKCVLRNRQEWKELHPISMCSIHSGNNSAYGAFGLFGFSVLSFVNITKLSFALIKGHI